MASDNPHSHITPPAAKAAYSPKNKGPKGDSVRFPQDRRQTVWIKPRVLVSVIAVVLALIVAAWIQYGASGLPTISDQSAQGVHAAPGFPLWLRLAHYTNFLLMILILRSGLQILWDHPRLYTNVGCALDSEWIRFTPTKVPKDRLWTANDDQRYLPPWLGLPGYRHTIGMARQWHFLCDGLWILTGVGYIVMLFVSGHWARVVPTTWEIVPQAWANFVYYATLHLPPEPDGYFLYNALQQLAYFGVVFILAPLSLLSGIAMSPAFDNRFPWYPRLFGGRQSARSFHFILLVGYVVFIVIHVTLVVTTGFARNMNHIVMGQDNTYSAGWILGLIGIAVVIGACFVAHWIAWNHPRAVQRLSRKTVGALEAHLLDPLKPTANYERSEISPYHWPNGALPTSQEWLTHAESDFKDYRLKVFGLVENPVELSMEDIKKMDKEQHTNMHHCIQGWSGIAEWGGLSISTLADVVRPLPQAKVLVFYSFGDSHSGKQYYDTQQMENALQPQSILAYEMNYEPLNEVYGAPIRLRVENQLGYKMVKWIKSIEFVESEKSVGMGYGGIKEDEEYFDILPEI